MDCCPPGSSVHGILQAGILEWDAMPSSRGSNPGLPHCRWTLYYLSHQGSPGNQKGDLQKNVGLRKSFMKMEMRKKRKTNLSITLSELASSLSISPTPAGAGGNWESDWPWWGWGGGGLWRWGKGTAQKTVKEMGAQVSLLCHLPALGWDEGFRCF